MEKWVAIAIWKLTMPECYHSIANHFSMARSTGGIMIMQVGHSKKKVLLHQVINPGNAQIIDGNCTMGFLNCIGEIDGTHVPVIPTCASRSEFINRFISP